MNTPPASKIVKRIMQGEAPWSELFEGQEFFRAYRYYVRVVASSTGGDEQQKWAYRVESNIRHFIANMELVEHVSYAHPFPTSFEAVRRCATAKEVLVAQACGRGAVYDDELEEADPADDEWATVVFSTSFWIGIAVEKKRGALGFSSGAGLGGALVGLDGGTGQRKLDLSWPTDEFTKAVKTWDRFDESSMVLVVSYLKVNDIPPEIADRTGQAKIFKKERRQSSRDEGVGEEEDGEVDDDAAPVAEVRTADTRLCRWLVMRIMDGPDAFGLSSLYGVKGFGDLMLKCAPDVMLGWLHGRL
ncbi:hypothetical protein BC938DRAFT_475022 [Jimgerdemannia flammicorona]|uniref:Poly(A) polymerase RNA-binding domain-containing protein n=1 Tax=Jimgerdemannia flammicorona TaxID=994334 RepID=A0A433QS38_9FUNG|nr:hypothetical protein BC938DRAFT_475022 [Jimgerdemannia flammicorona]